MYKYDNYTPGIYAEGYIVFRLSVRLFVCLFVLPSVSGIFFQVLVKVSQVMYISAITYHKAFIFGPQLP